MWGGGIQPKTVRLIGGVGNQNEFGKQFRQQHRVYDKNGLVPAENAQGITGLFTRRMDMEEKEKTVEDYLITAKDGEQYGIFRLSPLECLLLMNVRREDAEKMLSVNSNTQCYKTAGNSIVVSVLVALFSQLNINGIKKWNDMTDDERYSIIRPGE